MSGRVEIITRPERRRRWSEEEKLQLVRDQSHAPIDDRIQVGRLYVHWAGARKGQEIFDQVATAPAFIGNQVQALFRIFLLGGFGFTALNPFLEKPGVGQNAGEGIIDLMCNNGGHFADCGHLLNMQHVLMGSLHRARHAAEREAASRRSSVSSWR